MVIACCRVARRAEPGPRVRSRLSNIRRGWSRSRLASTRDGLRHQRLDLLLGQDLDEEDSGGVQALERPFHGRALPPVNRPSEAQTPMAPPVSEPDRPEQSIDGVDGGLASRVQGLRRPRDAHLVLDGVGFHRRPNSPLLRP
jgi:hypothetical protein